MIHPAFIALARQPGLFLEHAGAYVDLASTELDECSLRWKRRAALGAAGVGLVALGLVLAGGAGLVLAAVPLNTMPMPWLLALVPSVPLVLGAGLACIARRRDRAQAFAALRQQVALDLATLRLLGEQE